MKLVSLIGVSLLTGLLWRLEIELRWTWASLDWIGHFHWAVPVASAIFLAWVWLQLGAVPPKNRQFLIVLLASLGIVAYILGSELMGWGYARWLLPPLQWIWIAFAISPFVLYAILGVVYFASLWKLRIASIQPAILGVVVFVLACPIAILLLWATHHKGGPNVIHAIKSGFVFPLISFGLGFPLVTTDNRLANKASEHTR